MINNERKEALKEIAALDVTKFPGPFTNLNRKEQTFVITVLGKMQSLSGKVEPN